MPCMRDARSSHFVPPASRSLRIALVTETWPPEINGVAHTLGKLVSGLRQLGHRIELVRPRQDSDAGHDARPGEEFLVRGMPIPMYQSLRIGLPTPGQLLRHWQHNPPEIVHVATEGPLGLAALNAARKLKIPVSSSYHSNFAHYSTHYGFDWMRNPLSRYLRYFHNRSRLTLVPTHALAGQLTASGYRNVEVLARGVDTVLFNPARRSHALRVAWGVRPETLVALYVGRLAPEKNLGLLLDAFQTIQHQNQGARLVLVGDGPARRTLQEQYPQHIFAGMCTGTDLATHYASADLFLFPSLTETYGNVTLEALASGLPVIAFDMAAAAEQVQPGVNGQRVPPGDNAAFCAACAALTGERAKLRQMRERARSSVEHQRWEDIQTLFAAKLHQTIRLHDRKSNHDCGLIIVPD